MSSSFVVRMIDQLSTPGRAMANVLKGVLAAEKAVGKASKETQVAVSAAGAAMATAGVQAAAGARQFERAAQSMRVAARSASYAKAQMGMGFMGGRNAVGRAASFTGGRRMLGTTSVGQKFGPVFNPSAQGAAAGGMGPVLDRQAQGFGMFQRLGHGVQDGVRGLMRWNSAAGDSIDKWQAMSAAFMRTPFGFVLGGLGQIGSVLWDVVGAVGSALLTVGKLTIALGAIAAIGFTKMVVEMGAFADSSKKALGFITGSDALGRKEFSVAVQLAKDLGTNVEDVVGHYSKLRAMQFTAGEAVGLVRLSGDLKAITGDAFAAERALRAMTQINAKGRLQSEELVGQLAEAGVSTVLVYKELEKMLGTDRKGVLSKLQGGKIDADTGLVAIVRALKAKYHVSEVGTIGEDFAEKTLGGAWEALKNAPARMFMQIGERISTGPLVAGLALLKAAIEGAFQGRAAVDFVNRMVAGVSKLIPLVISFSEGFGTGLQSIANALSFGEAGNIKQWAFDAGQGVATFFTRVIEITKQVVPEIGRAIAALFEGLNVNKLLADMKTFDWKSFGQDLVTIAGGLGAMAQKSAQLIRLFSGPSHASTDSAVQRIREKVGLTKDGLIPGITPMSADEFDEYGLRKTPSAEPVIDPAKLSASAGVTNHFQIPITVQGDASPEAREAMVKAMTQAGEQFMRRFAQGGLAQAT